MAMGKPLGLAFGVDLTHGAIVLGITGGPNDRVGDKVWEAVQEARAAGWTPKQLISEMREAWEYEAKEELRYELEQFNRSGR